MIYLKEKVLKDNQAISDEEKELIKGIVSVASNHLGASDGEITAYKLLHSLTYNGNVCMADVLYHFEFNKICSLLKIQAQGQPISDFWGEKDI